jgi:hypothetical protein
MIKTYLYGRARLNRWLALKILFFAEPKKIIKGAARAGAEWVLKNSGLALDDYSKTLIAHGFKHLAQNLDIDAKYFFKGGYYEDFFEKIKYNRDNRWFVELRVYKEYKYISNRIDIFWEKCGPEGFKKLATIKNINIQQQDYFLYCATGIANYSPLREFECTFGPPVNKKLPHNKCVMNGLLDVFKTLKQYNPSDVLRAAVFYNRPEFLEYIKCKDFDYLLVYNEFPNSPVWEKTDWPLKFKKMGNMPIDKIMRKTDMCEMFLYLKKNKDLARETYYDVMEYNMNSPLLYMIRDYFITLSDPNGILDRE